MRQEYVSSAPPQRSLGLDENQRPSEETGAGAETETGAGMVTETVTESGDGDGASMRRFGRVCGGGRGRTWLSC